MASLGIGLLKNSRIARAIETVEKGGRVDWNRLATLQALDIVRAGQLFLVDALEREDEADEQLRQFADGG